MARYINDYNSQADYETARETFRKPHVSYLESGEVKYNDAPCNVITYTASEKQTKIFDYNRNFGAELLSHEFENGVGTLTFDGPVTMVGGAAFQKCSGMTSVYLPISVTTIGFLAFAFCEGLKKIQIPDCVTDLGGAAFQDCCSLETIEVPLGITKINTGLFNFCSGLTSVSIPNKVTEIGDNAFSLCASLREIKIPDKLEKIGEYAFQDCRELTELTFPDTLTSIGDLAFNGCSALESITFKSTVPPTINDSTVFQNTNNCPIFVPKESLETYRTASGWALFPRRIFAIGSTPDWP